MAAIASDEADIIGVYDGQMIRQMMMGRLGIGGWRQVPLPAATLELTRSGVKATQHGWGAWLFGMSPWTCNYREIQNVEAIRVSAGFD